MNFIYLDNNATTKVDQRVLNTMLPFFTEGYGNSSSAHYFGQSANLAVKAARSNVAELINANDTEIIFTSGATEGANLALKGLTLMPLSKRHIITVQTEHSAVLDTCRYLEKIGFEITYLPVDSEGVIDLELLRATIRKDTLAICVMWVNNETGVINDIASIGKIASSSGLIFISDATQAVGKIEVDVIENNIDILFFSSHKFHGPKGVGAVYINKKSLGENALTVFQHGGGHENGIRSGTLNVPGIVGIGKACDIAKAEIPENTIMVSRLKDLLETKLIAMKGATINGHRANRIYNTTNFRISNFDANIFIGLNRHIAVSNGSACTAAIFEPSHVLKAMHITDQDAFGSLRVSLSRDNTEFEVLNFIDTLKGFTGK